MESLKEGLKGLSFEGTVTLEMGRCIAAACGSYVTEVVDCKKNLDVNYCITDGGIHQVNYYGQTMAMKLPYYRQIPERLDGPEEKWNVCGSLCTVSDALPVKQLPLQGSKVGDRLVFEADRSRTFRDRRHCPVFKQGSCRSVFLVREKRP